LRQPLIIQCAGQSLVGTAHLRAQATTRPSGQSIGVLMLSFGQQPRSWVGDLGVAVAERTAAAGYSAFRFDMPGLGDSPGDIPVHLEVLWRSIQEGAHGPIARALVGELKRRFNLRGLVVGGFCGGAVTATFCAAQADDDILGLFMLEPEIALTPTPEVRAVHEVDTVSSFLERIDLVKRRLRSPASWRRLLSGDSDLLYWKGLLDYALARRRAARGGEVLPPDTNRRLLAAWQQCTRRHMPVLVISAGGATRRKYYAAYNMQPGRSEPDANLTWNEIENTTHAMLAGGAKRAVPDEIETWLGRHFPLDERSVGPSPQMQTLAARFT